MAFSDPFGLCKNPPCGPDWGARAQAWAGQQLATLGKVVGGLVEALSPISPEAVTGADPGSPGLQVGVGERIYAQAAATLGILSGGEGERVVFSGSKLGSGVARELGLARRELGNRIEAIKKAAGLGGEDNVIITNIGNVFNKATKEFLDNVHDLFPNK